MKVCCTCTAGALGFTGGIVQEAAADNPTGFEGGIPVQLGEAVSTSFGTFCL